jgi:hypothetical protein
VTHTLIELPREERIPVVQQEAVPMIGRNRFAELLEGPFRRGMRRDMAMPLAAAGVCDDHTERIRKVAVLAPQKSHATRSLA